MENNIQALPFRQVHLDFHTSEKIAGVGADLMPTNLLRHCLSQG